MRTPASRALRLGPPAGLVLMTAMVGCAAAVPTASAMPAATAKLPQAAPMTPFPWAMTPPPGDGDRPSSRINDVIRIDDDHTPVKVDLRGWSTLPGAMTVMVFFAIAHAEGGLSGWGLFSRDYDYGAVIRGTGQFDDPRAVVMITVRRIPRAGIAALARREARRAWDGGGRVAGQVRLPAGPAIIVRSASTVFDGTVFPIIEYVVGLGSRRAAVLTFGADRRRIGDYASEFRRVATSLNSLA